MIGIDMDMDDIAAVDDSDAVDDIDDDDDDDDEVLDDLAAADEASFLLELQRAVDGGTQYLCVDVDTKFAVASANLEGDRRRVLDVAKCALDAHRRARDAATAVPPQCCNKALVGRFCQRAAGLVRLWREANVNSGVSRQHLQKLLLHLTRQSDDVAQRR